ncbi:phosphoribosyltransferase [Streptomyces sulfonofaciens]|uniref:Phosphoribosyltransferase n=1 Tax=Streptomyces sulfonofaciens TaxID=68272 RepID=A0A919L512_9ACTN|nr:phosphoribosyltransferase [Streptomyces sulfonofaciens]GHH84343.1 phosphoribosyltransferase [Streptomyces sulfonofaciens]
MGELPGVGADPDPSTARLRELLGLAVRRNPKRAHLLVSNVLGKHVPQDPTVVWRHGYELGLRVRDLLGEDEARRAVVLGYAETATGLGHSVADGLALAPYLHSTRRSVPGLASAGGFEEAHSHATSHLLLPEDPALLAGDGPLVLVDDEFSTGNTVLNTMRALHQRFPRTRYMIVALVDMRSPQDRVQLAHFAREIDARVDLIAAARGTVLLPDGVLEAGRALVARHETPERDGAARGADEAPGGTGAGSDDRELSGTGLVRGDGTTGRDGTVLGTEGVVRVDLEWPGDVPDGGRHGFSPRHRTALEAALPRMARRLAGALEDAFGGDPRGAGPAGDVLGAAEARAKAEPRGSRTASPRPRVLVLGFEELMYAPLRLAVALQAHLHADIRFSTTTRSPVLAVDDPGYAIRSRLVFPAHDNPDDGPGERYAYNVAGAGFDAVVAVVDSAADTPALHATHGLLAQLATHTPHVLLVVIPSYVPTLTATATATATATSPPAPAFRAGTLSALPEPLRGPDFSSYAPDEVGWLLQDLSDTELEAPTEEREEAIQQGGAHYAESLPVEYQPSAAYQQLFHAALGGSAARIAEAVGTVTETVLAELPARGGRGNGRRGGPPRRPVLVSLARAGTPVGILMRRWARHRHGLDLPHYAVSIVRGRGIDANALRWLAAHHDPSDVVFVDGWTGKGAITRELAEALDAFRESDGIVFDPQVAVLADPGSCVRTYGTREDFLIPSACLNSTVSGLVSRTVLRADLVGPDDFHGAKFYRELSSADVSHDFLDAVSARFDESGDAVDRRVQQILSADRAPTWEGWAAVERISKAYGIHDVNLVKPGVGETTRVLLRRVPWRVLARRGTGTDLDHIRLLAEQRGVPIEEADDLPYICVGLIHPRFTRGATGADGRAVVGP